jgi:hypothetical protein
MNYIFTKSGSVVRIVEASSVRLNGKTLKGFTVERVDTGKRMFAPAGSLVPSAEGPESGIKQA